MRNAVILSSKGSIPAIPKDIPAPGKLCSEPSGRMFKQFFGVSRSNNFALIYDHQILAHTICFILIMGNQNEGLITLL